MILADELRARLESLTERVHDVPPHRRAHVSVLIGRLERLVPEPDDDEPSEAA